MTVNDSVDTPFRFWGEADTSDRERMLGYIESMAQSRGGDAIVGAREIMDLALYAYWLGMMRGRGNINSIVKDNPEEKWWDMYDPADWDKV